MTSTLMSQVDVYSWLVNNVIQSKIRQKHYDIKVQFCYNMEISCGQVLKFEWLLLQNFCFLLDLGSMFLMQE